VARGLPDAEQRFVDLAALYRSRNMTSRAVALLYKAKQIYPQSYLIAANLGSALAQAERYTEGIVEMDRALSLQPTSTLVLDNIGTYHAKRNDYARALDFWNRSLSIDPRQPRSARPSKQRERICRLSAPQCDERRRLANVAIDLGARGLRARVYSPQRTQRTQRGCGGSNS